MARFTGLLGVTLLMGYLLSAHATEIATNQMGDQRAGLWESQIDSGPVKRNFFLHLEIRQDIGASLEPTETLSGLFVAAEQACSFRQQALPANQSELDLICLVHEAGEFIPDGRHLKIKFRDRLFASAAWNSRDHTVILTLHRLPNAPAQSSLVGDWIARGPSETCSVHIAVRDQPNPVRDALDPSRLIATVDVFGPRAGSYGIEIDGIGEQGNGEILDFSLQGEGTSRFIGRLDSSKQSIIGIWPGHPDCDVFMRAQ